LVFALLVQGGHWVIAAIAAALWGVLLVRLRPLAAVALVWAMAGFVAGLLCLPASSSCVREERGNGRYVGIMEMATGWQETLSGGRWLAHLGGVFGGQVECSENFGPVKYPRAGERWLVLARVNGLVPAANPHAFDHRGHLAARGIVGRVELRARLLIRAGRGYRYLPSRLAGWWHERVRDVLGEVGLRALDRGVLWALLAGNQRLLPRQARGRLATAGVAHLMAISGLHLGCFSYFVLKLVEFFLAWILPGFGRRWAFFAGWLAGGWFLIVCGFPTSAVRAFVMLSGLVWGKVRGRDYDLWTWLAVATVGILGLRPHALYEAGFQLSTLAVAAIAIAYGAPRRHREPPSRLTGRLMRRVGDLARVGGAAWSGTLAPAWWHFGTIAWWSVPVNILFVPVVSMWVLPMALISVPLHWVFEPLSRATIKGSAYTIEALDSLLVLLAPVLEVGTLPWPGLGRALLIAGGLLSVVVLRSWQNRVAGLAMALVLALALPLPVGHAGWSLRVFHVGDGDMALLQLPCGERWLVDGGPPGAGRKVLSPYLRREGVGRLDRVFITHGHADHYGGLLELDSHIALCEIWTNGGPRSLDVAATLQARHRGCGESIWPVVRLGVAGLQCTTCGTRLEILWPPPDWLAAAENDNSLALEVTYEGERFVLAGDLEGRGRDESGVPLVIRLWAALELVRPTLGVKVPHHGRRSPLLHMLLMGSPASHLVVSSGRRGASQRPATAAWPGGEGGWWWWTPDRGAVEFFHGGSQWQVHFFRSTSD